MKGPGLTSLFYLLVSPGRFVEPALEFDEQAEAEELARRNLKTDPNWRETHRSNWRTRAKIVRRAWWGSAMLGVVAVTGGWLSGRLLSCVCGRPPAALVAGFQYAGIGAVLFATMAKVGWYSPTLGGHSYLEQADLLMFRVACCLGSGLMVLSVSWP